MIRALFFIAALVLMISCSTNSKTIPVNEQEYDPNALYYYSMAETALQMKDLNSAAKLLRTASDHSPDDLMIKERLLEVLSTQAKFKPEIHNQVITMGEECAKKKDCPNKILIILAESYSHLGNLEKGDKYLKKALYRAPSMQLYLSYYLFRKSQLGDDVIEI